MKATLARRITAEFIGTAFLLMAVVGSRIMGERLSGGNVAVALLANSIATGAALVALIVAFAEISGAHFNPVVTFSDALLGGTTWTDVTGYCVAQICGAFAGVAGAHAMFGLPLFALSHHGRSGRAQAWSEFVATFGLVVVIFTTAKFRSRSVPVAVGCYIAAAYWFTASTSFANPAVTMARTVTDTFAGIRPVDAPAFVIVQFCAALAATKFFHWLAPQRVVPSGTSGADS
jgi:glycerol uptake facilitator-like aquaporin